MDRFGQHVQEPGLPAPLRRSHHCQPGGVLPGGLELRRRHPEGDRVQGLGRGRNHELGYLGAQFVQQVGAWRRLRVGDGLQAPCRVRLAAVSRTIVHLRYGIGGLGRTQMSAGLAGDGRGGPGRSGGGGIGVGVLGLHSAAPHLAAAGLHALAAGSDLTGLLGSPGASGVAPSEALPLLAGVSVPRATTDSTSTPCHSPAFLCQLSAEAPTAHPAPHAASPSKASRSAVTTR